MQPSQKHVHNRRNETAAHVVGHVLLAAPEPVTPGGELDHIWVTLDTSNGNALVVTLNTFSRRNRDAGFDSRVRMARVREPGAPRPTPGIYLTRLLDYDALASTHNLYFETWAPDALQTFLLDAIPNTTLFEAWGFLFGPDKGGLHQVHCRHASCAVPEDLHGLDGGVRLHRNPEAPAELLLFKFCGQ